MNDEQLAADREYQQVSLQGVSRTFALTIPELPGELSGVVSNAYLLCRIADTIEDEPALSSEEKEQFSEQFIAVVGGQASAAAFARALHPRLSERMLDSERDLVYNTDRVIRITESFRNSQRRAMQRCIRIMSRGMAEFQQNKTLSGLENLSQLDRYCYHVAGVVGEMLTEIFCDYSPEIDAQREELLKLAVSFGQGLQMTNILKDIWEDQQRGACWLPRDVFERAGFDLARLSPDDRGPAFREGLAELVAIARGHLSNALEYTLMLPADEKGMRRFCLWALGMAVLTLRKINAHLDFTSGREVKISRNAVRATILVTNVAVRRDALLRLAFEMLTRGLPSQPCSQSVVSA